jgi:uncharacterized membrane protein YkvA (DUF1232 family)
MFETIKTILMCGTVLMVVFMVLLAMPQSQLRDILVKTMGWVIAILCGLYVVSPVDIMPEALLGPFGVFDDIGAIVVGVGSAMSAMSAGKQTAAA